MRCAIASAVLAVGLLASAGAAQAACSFDIAAGVNDTGKGIPYPGAEGRDRFMKKEPIAVGGVTYGAYGLPRTFGAKEFPMLERAGVFSGVIVFAEKGQSREVIYVPVNAAACTFQPYQKVAK